MYDDFTFLKSFNTLWIYTALKLIWIISIGTDVSIPSEFTLLSNISIALPYFLRFQYPLNLHCSQTVPDGGGVGVSFNTLWIYTALKLHPLHVLLARGFNTLWIYTALKQKSISNYNKTVSIPSEFTLLSNGRTIRLYGAVVSIPSEFTLLSNSMLVCIITFSFQYPLNLHCSQTIPLAQNFRRCFNTLWIYTALKPWNIYIRADTVSIPSEFTLLSNLANTINPDAEVSIPSEFTLLSNCRVFFISCKMFQYPLNLHCSQTICVDILHAEMFQYPLNLHCSQTIGLYCWIMVRFQYPLNLHCSQTYST